MGREHRGRQGSKERLSGEAEADLLSAGGPTYPAFLAGSDVATHCPQTERMLEAGLRDQVCSPPSRVGTLILP